MFLRGPTKFCEAVCPHNVFYDLWPIKMKEKRSFVLGERKIFSFQIFVISVYLLPIASTSHVYLQTHALNSFNSFFCEDLGEFSYIEDISEEGRKCAVCAKVRSVRSFPR